jgi:hypothetical protein
MRDRMVIEDAIESIGRLGRATTFVENRDSAPSLRRRHNAAQAQFPRFVRPAA